MEYELSIKLNAINNATAQINSVSGAVGNLGKAAKTASSGGLTNFGKTLESTGSRINVLGQRMTWMVSVPLMLFANRMINTAVEIETAWVRFRKVFNGTEEDVSRLQESARNLSNKFGRPIEEIINVMTEFNKAGVSSTSELEKLGQAVSETAIIFDVEMTDALAGVKSVMMGFNLTADETQSALAALNIIADKTTASEQGILDVFNRTAGVARQAGFSIRELAASQAVFEKNAIPAGRAGNAMKSILTSLTKQSNIAKDQFKALGVDMTTTSWRTAEAGEKFNILAKKLLEVKQSGDKVKLADLNEAMASLVGKFQVNNLNVLLEDLAMEFDNNAETISQFNEGLRVSADETENLKFKNQQLQKVLESSPQKLEVMNQMYRNQQVIIGNQLLPIKLKLLEIMTKLLEKFNGLSPETQKWIVTIGGILVILGPLLAGVGLLTTGIGFFISAMTALATATGLASLAFLPLILVIGSIVAAVTLLYFAWTNNWGGIQQKTQEVISGIINFYNQYLVPLWNKVVQDNAWVLAFWKSNWESVKIFFGGIWDAISGIFKVKWAVLAGLVKISIDIFTGNWKKAWEDMKSMISIAMEGTKQIWNGAWTAMKSGFSASVDFIMSKITGLINKIKQLVKEARELGGKISDKLGFNLGGIVPGFANGGMVYATNGYLSRGKDTIPAMLSPGEMVLNKSQQSNLFNLLSGKSQMQTAGGPVVNINVGTMVASPGEQREFARLIKQRLEEDSGRY